MSESITSANSSVEETISLYENLLKSSPNDSAALEALASAYEQAGNTLRARATLIRLSRVLINKRDTVAAARVIEMLRPHAEADFDALEALTTLDIFVKESPEAAAEGAGAAPAPATEPPPSGVILDKIILNREMSLAWDLCSDGRLKQEEYSQIIEDLTVQIAESRGTAISVLHAVVDRQIPGFDGLMQHLSEKSRHPFIDLSAFEPQPPDLRNVPKSYLMRQGAVVFDEIGGEYLVGLLNPVDKTLRKDLRHYLGVPCHFYLVAPEAFDKAWMKIGN